MKRFTLVLLTALLIVGLSMTATAATTITGATGGTAISADNTGGTYTILTGPKMVETTVGSIGTGTVILNVPTGFVFDGTSATVVVTNTGTNGNTMTASITAQTTTTITFTVTRVSGGNRVTTVTFSGIHVRPSSGTPLASGNITRTGTATITGESSANYGTLTEVVGAAAKLAFTSQPNGTDASQPLNPQPVVQINDQFGNKTASTASVVMSLTTGTGTLVGTTTKAAVAGVATFTDLSITTTNLGPFGLTASSGTFTAAVSTTWSFSVLPVEMTSFTATAQSANALLAWSTATEVNNFGFNIERRAIASSAWAKVGFVAGNGTSNATHNYTYADNNLSAGTYAYRIKQIDNDGTFKYSASTEVTIAGVPKELKLFGNYPNPFNPTTMVQFSVPENGNVRLSVYNVLGQEVATLFNGSAVAGNLYTANFNASRMSSGIYFSVLQFGNQRITSKMLLTK